MTWAQAKDNATALGGYLATLNTKAENVWIWNQFETQVWIGANDIATEGTWVWDNGTTSGDSGLTDNICGTGCDATASPKVYSDATWADGTQKWNGNEPNNQGTEDCANITNPSGYWNDLSCSNNQYGIIEFD